MIHYARHYEPNNLKQHSVGMTAASWDGANTGLCESSADWISPNTAVWDSKTDPYAVDPPVVDGKKVTITDSDHISYDNFINDAVLTRAWVWKSFARGHNPILMEDYIQRDGLDRWARRVGPHPHLCRQDGPGHNDAAGRLVFDQVLPSQSQARILGVPT